MTNRHRRKGTIPAGHRQPFPIGRPDPAFPAPLAATMFRSCLLRLRRTLCPTIGEYRFHHRVTSIHDPVGRFWFLWRACLDPAPKERWEIDAAIQCRVAGSQNRWQELIWSRKRRWKKRLAKRTLSHGRASDMPCNTRVWSPHDRELETGSVHDRPKSQRRTCRSAATNSPRPTLSRRSTRPRCRFLFGTCGLWPSVVGVSRDSCRFRHWVREHIAHQQKSLADVRQRSCRWLTTFDCQGSIALPRHQAKSSTHLHRHGRDARWLWASGRCALQDLFRSIRRCHTSSLIYDSG